METSNQPVDRYGSCPNCKISWDGGDIYDHIRMMDINAIGKPPSEVANLAKYFGWSTTNRTKFSRVNIFQIFSKMKQFVFYQCPKCFHVYDANTSEHFNTIDDARKRDKEPVELGSTIDG